MPHPQNAHLRTSAAGNALIKYYEVSESVQDELDAYLCPAGKVTIGYGYAETYGTYPKNFSNKELAGKPLKLGQKITEAEANELYQHQLKDFEGLVKKNINVPLTQGQFDALVSFTFNGGEDMARLTFDRINAGNFKEASEKMKQYDKAIVNGVKTPLAGLTVRREDEFRLFQEGLFTIPNTNQTIRAEPTNPPPVVAPAPARAPAAAPTPTAVPAAAVVSSQVAASQSAPQGQNDDVFASLAQIISEFQVLFQQVIAGIFNESSSVAQAAPPPVTPPSQGRTRSV